MRREEKRDNLVQSVLVICKCEPMCGIEYIGQLEASVIV